MICSCLEVVILQKLFIKIYEMSKQELLNRQHDKWSICDHSALVWRNIFSGNIFAKYVFVLEVAEVLRLFATNCHKWTNDTTYVLV